MENNKQRYEIIQDGIRYILSTEIYNGSYVRLICVESDKKNPLIYIGDFSLQYLRQLSTVFNSTITIEDAQNKINSIIEDQKLKIIRTSNLINISLFLLNNNAVFTLEPTKLPTQVEVTYSPVKYLPTKHVYLPPQTIRRPTVHAVTQNNNINYTTIPVNENISLPLTPRRKKQTVVTTVEPLEQIQTADVFQSNNNDLHVLYSPKREVIEFNIPGSPSSARINYGARKNNIINYENYLPISTRTTETIITDSVENQRITELQKETNRIKEEHESLKNETKKLIDQIQQLTNQIQILKEENKNLRENQGIKPNTNEIHEIIILKQEVQRLSNELTNLRNEKDNYIQQYTQMKDNEINQYKAQNEEYLRNQRQLQQENNDLKQQIQQLLLKNNIAETQNQMLMQSQRIENRENKEEYLEIVKGDILLNNEEIEMLTRKICKDQKKLTLSLLYKASVDSDRATAFHNKCDKAKSSIVLIQSGKGRRFGGFTTCDWSGNSINKKDDNAFIFSLDKRTIYDIIPGEDAIGCYPKYGPVFLGCQIRIYDEAFKNGGTTYEKGLNYKTLEDYELAGEQKFEVKEIEVYSVEFE